MVTKSNTDLMLAKRRKVSNLDKLRIRKRKEGGPGWKDEVWAGLKEVRSSNGCLNFGKVLTSQDFEFDFFFVLLQNQSTIVLL